MSIQFTILIIYFVFIIFLGILAVRKVKASEDLLVAGRNLGLMYVSVSIAAEYMGGLGTIGTAEVAFSQGMGVIWYHIASSFGLILFGFAFAHYYRKYNVITVPEFLYYLYDIKTWKAASVLNVVGYWFFTIIQMTALGALVTSVTGLDLKLSVLICGIAMTIYLLAAGMWSVAFTSVAFMLTIGTGIPIAFWWVMQKEIPLLAASAGLSGYAGLATALNGIGIDATALFSPFSLGGNAVLGYFLGGILGIPAAQATINYSFGAKNWKIARLAPVLAAILILPLSIWTGSMGLFARVAGLTENPKLALGATLMSIHPIIGGIGIAGVFAALISTVAGILFGCASIMAKDIWQRWLHPDTDDQYVARWTRIWILIIGISSSFGAMTLPKILNQAFFVYSIRGALMICVAFGIWWKRAHPDAAFWALVVALVGGIMYQFNIPINFEAIFKLHISVWCAILSLIIFIFISLRTNGLPKHRVNYLLL
jgi:SSS family solute:Na+ symporter